MAIAKATNKLIIFLGIYPPLAHLQDKSIEAHRVSLKPFNMLKMSFKTTKLTKVTNKDILIFLLIFRNSHA